MTKQAILIMAHNNLDLLNKLIELLDSDYFDIFLHIDKKSDINESDIYKCRKSNLSFYKEFDVMWADYSMVETEMFLFAEAYKNNYLYYHLISGVDLPLKSNKDIYEFFNNNYPKEFVHFEVDDVISYKINRIKYYHNVLNTKNNDFGMEYDNDCCKKQARDGINRIEKDPNEFRFGANWVSITHELVGYILSKKDYIEDRFPFTKSPDEAFIQTLVFNSKFKNNLYYDKYDSNYIACMRLVDWERGTPYTWKNDDYSELMNSNMMFARKFDENTDKDIINRIYKDIKGLNSIDN